MNVRSKDSMNDSLMSDPGIMGIFQKELKLFQSPFSERRSLLIIGDVLFVLLAVITAIYLRLLEIDLPITIDLFYERWYWLPVLTSAWVGFAWLNDLYDIPSANRKGLTAIRVGIVSAMLLATYLFVFFFNKDSLPRLFIIYFLVVSSIFIILWRWFYAVIFSAPPFRHRVLIVGSNERGATIAQALKQEPLINYNVLGVCR